MCYREYGELAQSRPLASNIANSGEHRLFIEAFYPRGANDARVFIVCLSMCLSVCHTPVGLLYQKRLNVGSRKHHVIARGL